MLSISVSVSYTHLDVYKRQRETIGFSKDRGDSVNVVTAPFTVDKVAPVAVPLWQQPELLDLARSFAWPLGTLLFGALVLMGAVRPALKVMAQPVPVRAACLLYTSRCV